MGERLDVGQEITVLEILRRSKNDARGLEHADVPFTPVAVRADVEEGDIRMPVVALPQGLDKGLHFPEEDRVIPGLRNDLLPRGG